MHSLLKVRKHILTEHFLFRMQRFYHRHLVDILREIMAGLGRTIRFLRCTNLSLSRTIKPNCCAVAVNNFSTVQQINNSKTQSIWSKSKVSELLIDLYLSEFI